MKIIVAGNYGAKNLGDEMILKGLLKILQEIDPEMEITVLSGNPEETRAMHHVKSVPMVPAGIRSFFKIDKKTLAAVKRCDFFILGGGGLFSSIKFRANIIWAIQALAAFWYKKPVICYGQSIGPIKSFLTKNIVKIVFKRATLITVRDKDSKKNLQQAGITKQIHVVPDPAFHIPALPKVKRENLCIVALRQMKGITTEFIDEIAEFLKFLHEKENKKIKFINFQEGPNTDQIIHDKIIEKVHGIVKKINYENIEEALGEFKKADFILGMRLHSVISAIKTETPFIAINYSPKVKSLLKEFKLEELSIDLEDVKKEEFIALYEKSSQKTPEFKEKANQTSLLEEAISRKT